jgi:hypothetical protein
VKNTGPPNLTLICKLLDMYDKAFRSLQAADAEHHGQELERFQVVRDALATTLVWDAHALVAAALKAEAEAKP